MDAKKDRSSVMLSSNIMIRSKFERDPDRYIPVDLLPAYCSDTRYAQFLSISQREQMKKKLFYAKDVVDVE